MNNQRRYYPRAHIKGHTGFYRSGHLPEQLTPNFPELTKQLVLAWPHWNNQGHTYLSIWPTMKLLVRNLARTTTEQEIQELFAAHGTVTECTLVLDKETGKSKGFGFVEMPDTKEAKLAKARLNDTRVSKNKIRVKFAQDKES